MAYSQMPSCPECKDMKAELYDLKAAHKAAVDRVLAELQTQIYIPPKGKPCFYEDFEPHNEAIIEAIAIVRREFGVPDEAD